MSNIILFHTVNHQTKSPNRKPGLQDELKLCDFIFFYYLHLRVKHSQKKKKMQFVQQIIDMQG